MKPAHNSTFAIGGVFPEDSGQLVNWNFFASNALPSESRKTLAVISKKLLNRLKEYLTKIRNNRDRVTSLAFNLPGSISSLEDLKPQFGRIELPKELEEWTGQRNGNCDLSNGQEVREFI